MKLITSTLHNSGVQVIFCVVITINCHALYAFLGYFAFSSWYFIRSSEQIVFYTDNRFYVCDFYELQLITDIAIAVLMFVRTESCSR